MPTPTLIAAETEDAWYERDNLQRLREERTRIEARIQVIEFRQTSTAIDPPQAA